MSKSRKLTWDPSDSEQVAEARKQFNAARKAGLSAYKYKLETSRVAVEIRRFDPKAGEILLVPQLIGG